MSDASHTFGNDLDLASTGDLLVVDGQTESHQRVLRRLLTNPNAYIWQSTYGAGLPSDIGSTVNANQIAASVSQQMKLEPSVAPSPAPIVNVQTITGGVFISTQYATAAGQPAALSFSITP